MDFGDLDLLSLSEQHLTRKNGTFLTNYFYIEMKPLMIVIYSHTALVTSAVILESYFSSHFGKMIDTIWLMTFLGYNLN